MPVLGQGASNVDDVLMWRIMAPGRSCGETIPVGQILVSCANVIDALIIS